MLSKNVLAASLLFASFQAILAAPQTATVSIAIDIGDADESESSDDVNLLGEVAGVGSDGTTYVLSYAETYTDDEFDGTSTSVIAETFTVVQDATHVSYSLVQTADLMTYKEVVVCGIDDNGNGVCTESYEESDSFATATETFVTSGSVLFYAAEVTTASASVSTEATGSTSGTSKGSSAASSGSGSSASNPSASASSSSSSSGASTIIASGFASIVASLFGVALLL